MILTILVLTLLANNCLSTEEPSTSDLLNICQQYGGYYRDQQNCKCFYQCNQYQVWRLCCPNGQAFDTRHKVCRPDDGVVCQSTQSVVRVRQTAKPYTTPCYASNSMFRHEDCGKYWSCYYRQLYEMRCPMGTLWNDDLKVCVLPQFATCDTLALSSNQANVFLKIPNFMPLPNNNNNQVIRTGSNGQPQTQTQPQLQPQPHPYAEQVDSHLTDILKKNKWLSSATYLTLDQNGRVIYGITKVSKFSIENNKTTAESVANADNSNETLFNFNPSDNLTTEALIKTISTESTEKPQIITTIKERVYPNTETSTQNSLETTDKNLVVNENISFDTQNVAEIMFVDDETTTQTNQFSTSDENNISTTTESATTGSVTELYNRDNSNQTIYSTIETITDSSERMKEFLTNAPEPNLDINTNSNTEQSVTEITTQTTVSAETVPNIKFFEDKGELDLSISSEEAKLTTVESTDANSNQELFVSTTQSVEDISETTTQSIQTESVSELSTEVLNESTTQSTQTDITESVPNSELSVTELNTESNLKTESELVLENNEESNANISDTNLVETNEGLSTTTTTVDIVRSYTETTTSADLSTDLVTTESEITRNTESSSQITINTISEENLVTTQSTQLNQSNTTPEDRDPIAITTERTSGAQVNPIEPLNDGNKETTSVTTIVSPNNLFELKVNREICKEVGGNYADQNDCKCFYVCDMLFRPYRHCCPDGLLYNENAEDLLCDYPDSVVCKDGSNLPVRAKRAIYYNRFVKKVNLNHLKFK